MNRLTEPGYSPLLFHAGQCDRKSSQEEKWHALRLHAFTIRFRYPASAILIDTTGGKALFPADDPRKGIIVLTAPGKKWKGFIRTGKVEPGTQSLTYMLQGNSVNIGRTSTILQSFFGSPLFLGHQEQAEKVCQV
jgi:pre-rRNA-processing protein TSR3